MNARGLFLLLMVFALGSGCLNLKPTEDLTRHFLLSVPPDLEPLPGAPAEGLAVGLTPLLLPAYLDSPWLAIRANENEIRYAVSDRWGERLEKGVRRVLAANLSQFLATEQVAAEAWRSTAVAFELTVSLRRCDLFADGRVSVEGRWQLLETANANVVWRDQHRVEHPGPPPDTDPAGAAAALSQALAEFSREIARSVLTAAERATPAAAR
jgi:uncharacterized lipoprotein YmbA